MLILCSPVGTEHPGFVVQGLEFGHPQSCSLDCFICGVPPFKCFEEAGRKMPGKGKKLGPFDLGSEDLPLKVFQDLPE